MERNREDSIKSLAREVGFSLAGIAGVTPPPEANAHYDRWLEAGMHGEMDYLVRHRDKRQSPSFLLEGARSAICVALNYYHEVEKSRYGMNGSDGTGAFSIYVHGQDYHEVMEDMLARLAGLLEDRYPGTRSIACVDTKPISDRTMALSAGIAWRGKNTSVVSPKYGSWIFLGELITDLDLKADPLLATLCAECTKCIDACPTGALKEPFLVDARKCISYLTIEKRGEVPADMHDKIGLNVYGCDACQAVCPFNDVAKNAIVFDRGERSPLVDMPVDELATISNERFREMTQGSAVRRCGPDRIRRNAKIVSKNISKMQKFRPGEKPKR